MDTPQPVLFVFVDGFGLGSADPVVNPLADRLRLPTLGNLLDASIPLNASLGVPGLPQSATGQAALLCGLNAPKLMGGHIEGFPPPRLKTVVQENNLFTQLLAAGKSGTFANAYFIDDVAHIPPKRESVTTVATLAAFGGVRGKAELADNRAVYHDLTREALRARGYTGPLVTPEQAAGHLMAIAQAHDFTLFEFFQSDHAGHSGDEPRVFQCLEKLDSFFAALQSFDGLLLVSSDHGNIEDITTRSHTNNPVPLYTSQSGFSNGLERIDQVAPAIISWLT